MLWLNERSFDLNGVLLIFFQPVLCWLLGTSVCKIYRFLRTDVPSSQHRESEAVRVELRPFNDTQLNRDLNALCTRVATAQPRLPDGRLLVFQGVSLLQNYLSRLG